MLEMNIMELFNKSSDAMTVDIFTTVFQGRCIKVVVTYVLQVKKHF